VKESERRRKDRGGKDAPSSHELLCAFSSSVRIASSFKLVGVMNLSMKGTTAASKARFVALGSKDESMKMEPKRLSTMSATA
jgi:hypothetical protein